MHFGIFVDRLVHNDKQPCLRKRKHVLMQVVVAARMPARLAIPLEQVYGARGLSITHSRDAQSQTSLGSTAAIAIAFWSQLTKPATCRPSGSPSSWSTGSEIAGMPRKEACTVQLGSPVESRPSGAADGADSLTHASQWSASDSYSRRVVSRCTIASRYCVILMPSASARRSSTQRMILLAV